MSQLSSRTLLATALLALAAALFTLSLAGVLGPAQDLLLRPLASAQGWLSQRFFAVRDLLTSPRDVAALQQRITELESENARLQEEIISLRELAAQTEILSALVDFASERPERGYLAARVIGLDPSPFLQTVAIGEGSDRGIQYGMPVVTDRGLVGRILEVGASSARVQLITDPASAVSVRLQDSRAEGILVAQPNGDLWVDMIDQDAEVKEGELVITSGLGGSFPADIPVGRVVNVRKRDYELFQEAVVQSAVNFEDLEIVLVITSFVPVEPALTAPTQ